MADRESSGDGTYAGGEYSNGRSSEDSEFAAGAHTSAVLPEDLEARFGVSRGRGEPVQLTGLPQAESGRIGPPPDSAAGRPDVEGEIDAGGDETTSGVYNPADYAHLVVPRPVAELFRLIGRYQPQVPQLDSLLKPFVPDYIPALGDIDEFIKVPRPDGRPDGLGLVVLDEPAPRQSDPAALSMQLRQASKRSGGGGAAGGEEVVGSIPVAHKSAMRIQEWIDSIHELHKSQPPTTYQYSKPMPDLEALMQEWPQQLEEAMATAPLPTAALDVDLQTLATMAAALLDVPVYEGNVVPALHAMFSLLLEFQANPAFAQPASAGAPELGHLTLGF